jgi:hypothetical protein
MLNLKSEYPNPEQSPILKSQRLRILFVMMLAVIVGMGPKANAQGKGSVVNFAHLDHLTETIHIAGDTTNDSVDVVHVYSNAPNYTWAVAGESGMEGIACVDDAARAAVTEMRYYELTHDTIRLAKARRLLNFVRKMETDDGDFYNFILTDRSINKPGQTSFKSFGWWAARGVWAMSKGFRIFKDIDPAFSESLRKSVEKAFPHIDSLVMKFGARDTVKGLVTPRWLLYQSGSDVTSELLLGLNQFYGGTKSPAVRTMIEKLAAAVMMMQEGDASHAPYGLHRSWETMWHSWGNGQTQALAEAGRLLDDKKMLSSAELEATGWYTRLIVNGMMREMDATDTSTIKPYDQIAYDFRPMSLGLLRLYDATGKKEYAVMAGLAASWLLGNNVLHTAVYDSASGRCYDGINSPTVINKNSGGESTIEALHTLLEVENYPLARKTLHAVTRSSKETDKMLYGEFDLGRDGTGVLLLDKAAGSVRWLEGTEAERFMKKAPK